MKKNLTIKENLLVGITLFGMFFGAGNLIFPVHMGQLAGQHVLTAVLGFIVTGVTVPILGVAAIGLTHTEGVHDLSNRAGKGFGYAFTCMLYLTIGPLFAIPRCATTSFTTGVSPMLEGLGESAQTLILLGFSAAFFGLVLLFSLKPSGIVTWVGKIITPIFLVFLGVLIFFALIASDGGYGTVSPADTYADTAFFNGFLEGYNTMDAIAGLAFGIIVIDVIRSMGVTDSKDIARNTLGAGMIAGALMALIYILTAIMGARSANVLEVSENGGIAFVQIAERYLGVTGKVILAVTITAACLKTAIGLVTSCSETFVKMFPKALGYRAWAIIFTVFSFAIANFGLSNIIEYSIPALMLLYPFTICMIALALCDRLFGSAKCVYIATLVGAGVGAFFDFLKALPFGIDVSFAGKLLPFFDLGLGWLMPAAIGCVIGLIVKAATKKKTA